MLKVAGMARSTYYYRRKPSQEKYKEERLRLKALYREHNGRYGYRRMRAALCHEGFVINHKTVRKLMKEEGLKCRIRQVRKKYFKPSPELAASPNLLNREFKAEAPFTKGVTDITEFKVGKEKVYVSALLDLYDGAVLSMVFSTKNNTDLVMSMFETMSESTSDLLQNMLIHSDQGILYRSLRYHEFMARHKIVQSMSHRGNCYDNALMESFFGTFKAETIRIKPISTIEELTQTLKSYATYYNRDRLKSTLGYRSPFQYRKDNGYEKYTYL